MTEANIKIVLEKFKELFEEEIHENEWYDRLHCIRKCKNKHGDGQNRMRLLMMDIFQRVNVKLQMQLWNGKI